MGMTYNAKHVIYYSHTHRCSSCKKTCNRHGAKRGILEGTRVFAGPCNSRTAYCSCQLFFFAIALPLLRARALPREEALTRRWAGVRCVLVECPMLDALSHCAVLRCWCCSTTAARTRCGLEMVNRQFRLAHATMSRHEPHWPPKQVRWLEADSSVHANVRFCLGSEEYSSVLPWPFVSRVCWFPDLLHSLQEADLCSRQRARCSAPAYGRWTASHLRRLATATQTRCASLLGGAVG